MAAFFLVLIACAGQGLLACTGEPSAPPVAAPAPAAVRVATVQAGGLDEDWRTLGEVVALDRAELAAGAAGPVSAVPFREGDAVSAGALLVQVDPSLAQANVQARQAALAQAQVERAQAERERQRLRQVEGRLLAARELDLVEARVEALEAGVAAAEASLSEARASLGRHQVRAPFDGVIARRHVDPGDWVQAGTPVVDLVSAARVELRAMVPFELGQRLKPEDGALARVDGEAWPLKVRAVVPALDPDSRSVLVRLAPTADPPPPALAPGRPVDLDFQVRAPTEGLRVPRDALVLAPGLVRVVKVEEGKAALVDVKVLATGADEALLQSEGLREGDRVVTRGNERVRPGQPLQVQEGG